MSKEQQLSKDLLDQLGGINNIKTIDNCMTRVRLTLHNESLASLDNLKKVAGVMGVIKADNSHEYQIIVGPGTCAKVKDIIEAQMTQSTQNKASGEDLKKQMQNKYNVSFNNVLKNIANIFIPLLPGFIACGLLTGIANVLKNPQISGDFALMYPNLVYLISIFGSSIFSVMLVFVGITTARAFGGSIAIGGALAGILIHPDLVKITLFGEHLIPARGGIISIMMVVYFACELEKFLKKYITGSLDLILVPLITISISGLLALVAIQPLGGVVAEFIGKITIAGLDNGGFVMGFALGCFFLPLVMTGLHQALIPIHAQLIQATGTTILLPILAMAGAGQVGAAAAVWFKTKNQNMKKLIKTSLPVGILGIGEPLIYGVTLPLGKPFITACVAGGFGGGVVALFKVGSLSIGISGLPLALSLGNGMILHYLIGLLTAYVMGFLLTFVVGFKDLPENS
jgi:PTS system sucrose-specific IIC component